MAGEKGQEPQAESQMPGLQGIKVSKSCSPQKRGEM